MKYLIEHSIIARPPQGGQQEDVTIPEGDTVILYSESLIEQGKPTVALIEWKGRAYECEAEILFRVAQKDQ